MTAQHRKMHMPSQFSLCNDKKVVVKPKFVKMPPSHFIRIDEIFAKFLILNQSSISSTKEWKKKKTLLCGL